MPKKPYTGSYKKRVPYGTGKGVSAGIGRMVPPIQNDANEIAAPTSNFKKTGSKSGRPNLRK
jgi:hypothetical protein